jgi:hypothetical protein
VQVAILSPGEKVHLIHRRHFDHEPHRHFVGTVDAFADGLLRVTGHVYAVDPISFEFRRREELRTRVVSAASGEVIINVLPATVDLNAVRYRQEPGALRVTDGSAWHLDISEVSWR